MNADEIRQRAGDLAALAAATEVIERKAGRGSTPACIVLAAVRVFFDEVNGLTDSGGEDAAPAPKARRGRPPKSAATAVAGEPDGARPPADGAGVPVTVPSVTEGVAP